jgi:crotonobetainyl-CoA:carnitine CoA-transferase CaiB-like acyl-CoA transferase
MQQILEGVTVVELGNGPLSGLVSMALADFGARVLWFEYGWSEADYRVWHRGKIRVSVNLASEEGQLSSDVKAIRKHIVRSADVFITDLSEQTLKQLQLDWHSLQAVRGDLVQAEVSGFGESNKFSHLAATADTLAADESLVAAAIGRMMVFEGVASRAGPVYSALKVGNHGASQALLAGILAQLFNRERTSRGQLLRSSTLRALTAYDLVGLGASQVDPSPVPDTDPHEVLPMLSYQPVQCADGRWLQLGNLLPHLQANFLRAVGLEAILHESEAAEDSLNPELIEDFRRRICLQMQTRSMQEWMDIFLSDGSIVAHPYQSTQQALADTDVLANGHSDSSHGVSQLGLLGDFTATPGNVSAAPQVLAMTDLDLPERVQTDAIDPTDSSLPLTGVTVVEAAAIIASPFGASMLADLGARVIKIEPIDGDPFREMAFGIGALRCNTGKQSIALNLKSAEGQAVAQALAAKADIFIHNYRPGVPERLGIDYSTLSAGNPKLVYMSVNGYGPNGPGALRPSTHPVPGAALGGVLYQFGELPDKLLSYPELLDVSRRLFRANEVNPDPNTSFVVASAATLGLVGARRLGLGQIVYLDMFGANAYANFDDFLSQSSGSARMPLDAEHLGTGPYDRLYPCKSGWLFVHLRGEKEQKLFHATVGAFAALKNLTADQWEEKLLPLGLGCIQADGPTPGDRIQAKQFAASELAVKYDHALHGKGLRHGAMSEWPNVARSLQGPCEAGDSTDVLMHELEFSSADIERMRQQGDIA